MPTLTMRASIRPCLLERAVPPKWKWPDATALTADVVAGKEPRDAVVRLLSCRTTTTKMTTTPAVACWLG